MAHRALVRALLAFAFLAALAPAGGSAQATAYLPNLDPAYRDLDGLIAGGWVKSVIAGRRPYSRLTIARHVVEARAAMDGAPEPPPLRFREALERLERSFAPEVAALCAGGGAACAALPTGARLRSASGDLTWAASPDRTIPSSYDTLPRIDAVLNPLFQRNEGRVLGEGGTAGVEALADVRLGSRVAAQIHPRLWITEEGAGGAGATLQEAYARALFGNFAVDVGRNHVATGHGPSGGPILSYNARGLDQVRISLDRPARLPWVFGRLGLFGGNILVADLGEETKTPHSKLVIFQGSLRPHPSFEMGAMLLNHQGGEGSPPATFVARLKDVFFLHLQDSFISDKVFGADVRLTLPAAKAQLYLEMLTTDARWEVVQTLTTEAVWIAGARAFGLGRDGRMDLWAEARYAGVRPHTHHHYQGGLTVDRRLIGDALGPLARGLVIGVDRRGSAHTAAASLAWERYSNADFYGNPADERFDWVRTIDNPDEIRLRAVADWTADPGPRRLAPSVRLAWERVTRFAFTPDPRTNFLAQVRFDYAP